MILVVTATYLAITFDQMVRFSLTRRRALGLLMGMAGHKRCAPWGWPPCDLGGAGHGAHAVKAISGAASVTLSGADR